MSIRDAAQQALEALEGWNNYGKWVWPESALAQAKRNKTEALTALRAALAEDAMQRLTDEQQMIERGTKAWAGVPDATGWVEELRGNDPVTDHHEEEGDKLAPPSDHVRDATKMIEPVAYVTGFSKGYAVVQPVDRSLLMPVGMALYRSPPTINELETVEPVAWMIYTLDGQSAFVTDNPADFTPEHRALPLYTSPPKREPLTDEEISKIFIYGGRDKETFARAIERAIWEKNGG